MLPRDILHQIRRLQLFARRAVENVLGGEYHSIFKGMGVAFEEVREYQPGDDVRTIDWNVTARMGHPFIKRYIEERELTVLLLVDCSGSQQFGSWHQHKREVAAELAALLAFSAISNNDKVGLIAFSDRIERYVPPRKGTSHVLRLIRDILYFQPRQRGTSIREALDFLSRVQHRRAIVFLLSDFLDSGYERLLKRTGRRHDLVLVRISDRRESDLPAVGFLELADAETGECLLVDTARPAVRQGLAAQMSRRLDELRRLAAAAQTDLIEVSTDGSHLDSLVRFFQMRERRRRRG